MIWMILGAAVPGLLCVCVGCWKLRQAREMMQAADARFGESGFRLLVADARREKADALCRYSAKELEIARAHYDRAREIMGGE